jgi:hypothetical protein
MSVVKRPRFSEKRLWSSYHKKVIGELAGAASISLK